MLRLRNSAAVEFWNEENFSLVDADGTERPALVNAILRPYAKAIAGVTEEVRYQDGVFHLSYEPDEDGISEVVIERTIILNL